MAEREIIGLNEESSRLEVPSGSDTYVAPARINLEQGADIPSGQDIGGAAIDDILNLVNNITLSGPIDMADMQAAASLNNVTMRLYPQPWDYAGTIALPSLLYPGEAAIAASDANIGGAIWKTGDLIMAAVENPTTADDFIRIPTGNGILTVNSVEPDAAGNIELTIDDLAVGSGFVLNTDIDTLEKLRTVSNSTLDEAGDPRPVLAHTHKQDVVLSYTYVPRSTFTGETYLGGFYQYDSNAASLVQNGSITIGAANNPHGGHAFMVFGAGGTDGTTIVVEASGTSIDDEGTLTPGDSEILVSAAPGAVSAGAFYQTTKRWIGTVTFTLSTDGVNATCDFNYGLVQYERTEGGALVSRIQAEGMAEASDGTFDVELLLHKKTGWTYAATGFIPGISIASFLVDNSQGIQMDEPFSWIRRNIPTALETDEGVMFRVVIGSNKAVSYLNMSVAVEVDSGSTGA
jgi:hypothetical protein